MPSSGARLRAIAAQIVDAVVHGGRSLDAAIESHESSVAERDRPLLRMLCYGTLRYYWRLQSWVSILVNKPLRSRDRVINALLYVAIYQIVELRIPDHAVVSETVEAARQLRRPGLAGLVNACLRRFVREELASKPPEGDEAIHNHPAWFIRRIKRDWPDHWEQILASNNRRAPMWLRVNRRRCTVQDYRRRLEEASIRAEPLAGLPDALCLAEPVAVSALPGFDDGDVSVQDGAAQLAAGWMLAGRKARVLDACAAPGGKTGHLLELAGDGMALTAIDSDPERVPGIRENLDRLGLDATILTDDASKPGDWWNGQPFDGVLLDAPCSASGVIRRHPDIKHLRRESDIEALSRLQRSLLKALWPTLRPGGLLVYVTCSVLAAENEDVVEDFICKTDDVAENDLLPNNNIRDLMTPRRCGYQVLPGTGGMDGFYYAALQRKVP